LQTDMTTPALYPLIDNLVQIEADVREHWTLARVSARHAAVRAIAEAADEDTMPVRRRRAAPGPVSGSSPTVERRGARV
jgi:hypothetical protein